MSALFLLFLCIEQNFVNEFVVKNFLYSTYSMLEHLTVKTCKRFTVVQTSQRKKIKIRRFQNVIFSVETYQCLYSFLHPLYDIYKKGISKFLLPHYLTTALISMSITKTFNDFRRVDAGMLPPRMKTFGRLFVG